MTIKTEKLILQPLCALLTETHQPEYRTICHSEKGVGVT